MPTEAAPVLVAEIVEAVDYRCRVEKWDRWIRGRRDSPRPKLVVSRGLGVGWIETRCLKLGIL